MESPPRFPSPASSGAVRPFQKNPSACRRRSGPGRRKIYSRPRRRCRGAEEQDERIERNPAPGRLDDGPDHYRHRPPGNEDEGDQQDGRRRSEFQPIEVRLDELAGLDVRVGASKGSPVGLHGDGVAECNAGSNVASRPSARALSHRRNPTSGGSAAGNRPGTRPGRPSGSASPTGSSTLKNPSPPMASMRAAR